MHPDNQHALSQVAGVSLARECQWSGGYILLYSVDVGDLL